MDLRISTVRLYGGDWHDRLAASKAALDTMLDDLPPDRVGEHAVKEKVDAHNALVAEADEAAEVVKVRALGRRKFRELKKAYPPREGNEDDARAGFDLSKEEEYGDDLVFASLVQPLPASRAAYDEWADGLSEVDYQRVAGECVLLNGLEAVDPKSLRASLPTQAGERNSSSPAPSASRLGD